MLAWGVAYVPSAWLVETWPPISAAGARLTLAGLMLLGVLALLGRPVRPGVGRGRSAWLALTQTVLYYGAVFWGIDRAGAGLSAVLANLDPLFIAVLAALFLGEVLSGPASGPASGSAWSARRSSSGRARSGRRSCRPTRWWWSAGPSPGASAPSPPRAGSAAVPSRSRWPAGR